MVGTINPGVCMTCGQVNDPNSEFCSRCGNAMASAGLQARMNSMTAQDFLNSQANLTPLVSQLFSDPRTSQMIGNLIQTPSLGDFANNLADNNIIRAFDLNPIPAIKRMMLKDPRFIHVECAVCGGMTFDGQADIISVPLIPGFVKIAKCMNPNAKDENIIIVRPPIKPEYPPCPLVISASHYIKHYNIFRNLIEVQTYARPTINNSGSQ